MSNVPSWWVWKFGGSSLSTFSNVNRVSTLITDQLVHWYNKEGGCATSSAGDRQTDTSEENTDPRQASVGPSHLAVVLSAIGGVTDLLETSLRLAERAIHASNRELGGRQLFLAQASGIAADSEHPDLFVRASNSHIFGRPLLKVANVHLEMLQDIETRHDVLRSENFRRQFWLEMTDIVCCLQAVSVTGTYAEPLSAYVLGFGEVWSVRLVTLNTQKSLQKVCLPKHEVKLVALDARDVLVLDEEFRGSDVRQHLQKSKDKKVVPGKCVGEGLGENLFLPRLSRSAIKLYDGKFANETTPQSSSAQSDGTEDSASVQLHCASEGEVYSIGPFQDPTNFVSDFRATWAFPPYDATLRTIFPPCATEWFQHDRHGPLPIVHWERSYKNFAKWFSEAAPESRVEYNSLNEPGVDKNSPVVVHLMFITGFIARQSSGLPTTLRRNGGDVSAVVFGALLRAEGVTIWSDVAGIYTGDPRYCSNARSLKTLSFEEALELAGIGAKVLHPGSLLPSIHMGLPLLLKSTFDPQHEGTSIADFEQVEGEGKFGKVVARVSDVVLVTLSNVPLYSITAFAPRLFGALERGGARPLFISQGSASSATSIAIAKKESQVALAAIVETFQNDVDDYGSRLKLHVDADCSILSVVGRGQSGFIGALSSWCAALKDSMISIKAVSQSINELSTSFVVSKECEFKAQEALHRVVLSGL